MGILGILLAAGLLVAGVSGFATYELFSHIMPRETGVPLGCIFGTLVGLGAGLATLVTIGDGIEWP